MKKILFLLLLSVAAYGQATFDEGIQLSGNQKTTTAPRVILQETDGVLNYQDTEVFSGNSSGAISGFAITDNGNGTANIASGQALLRATNSETGILQKYAIPTVTNLTLTDNANNYVLANYNAGNPTLTVTTDPTQINGKTTTIVYVIARVGNTLHYLNLAGANVDSNGKLRARFLNTEAIKRAQGMTIGFANRNISVTAGLSYSGLIPIQTTAFNTATGSTFTNFYGTTRQTGQTQINNSQYNNNGVLASMPNNSFRTDYVYVLANNPSKLYVIMGGTSPNLTAARAVGTPSTLPVELQYLGVLVGRTIIAKDATTITEVSSAFDVVFASNGVQNHNDLANIQGGSAGDYQHITATDRTSWDGKFNTPTGLTTNYLPKWNGTGFGNSQASDNGTNFHIGTTISYFNKFGVTYNSVDAGNSSADGVVFQTSDAGDYIQFLTKYGQYSAIIAGVRGSSASRSILINPLGGNTLFGKTTDAGDGIIQANGNITASPAVAPNQVVVKSQLDAFVPNVGSLEFNDTDKTVWNNGKGDIVGNTSFGEGALKLTTSTNNTAIGKDALTKNSSGSSNTALGWNSLPENTTGQGNIGIGGSALLWNSTGSNNVAIGLNSGTGINNNINNSIFIGGGTQPTGNNQTNQIVIGHNTTGSGSNTVTLGDANIVKTVLGGVIQKRALDTAPASATATGTTGEIRVTATHIYVCTATNTWVRSALTTW